MTVAARDRLSDLPLEVARHVFSFFDYRELLPVLGTCRSWRQIAIDCPPYWFVVKLDKPTEGEAQTFLSRLRGAKGRPAVVSAQTRTPWEALSSTILPEIASSIGSLDSLSITAHISHRDQVFHVLESPAPELVTLLIWFSGDPTNPPAAMLPRSLLQGQAPVLSSIYLINVDIPHPPPAIFASVTNVNFGYELPETETKPVPDLWSLFPNMTALTLVHNAVLGDVALNSERWRRLEWLRLEQTLDALLDSFERSGDAISCVPNVQIPASLRDAVDRFLRDVPSAIQVALNSDAPALVEVAFGDTAWRRSRTFYTLLSHWSVGEPPDCNFLSRLDVVERIVSLTIPAVLWQSATHTMLPLTRLSELRLVLDVESPVSFSQLGPLGTVVCPALKSLILRVEHGEYYVTLDQVRAFASEGLRDWRAPLELQFEDVTLVGYGRVVPDDKTFTYCWKSKKLWVYPDIR